MLSVVMETVGTVGMAAIVSMTSSWKFTLGYLAVVPVLVVTHALRLKTFHSRTKEEQKTLDESGQVRIYQVFKEQYVLYTIWDLASPMGCKPTGAALCFVKICQKPDVTKETMFVRWK